MQYMVVLADGSEFGPATLELLVQWASEDRITPETTLKSLANGQLISAGQVAGLFAPAPAQPTGKYFVVAHDGGKYGPADVATLAGWAAQKRLTPKTVLEQEGTGTRLEAGQVAGIFSAPAPQVAPVTPHAPVTPVTPAAPIVQPKVATPTPAATPFEPENAAPIPTTAPHPRPNIDVNKSEGHAEIMTSYLCAALGLLCCPILAQAFGIIFANRAAMDEHPKAGLAKNLNIISIVLVSIGLVVWAVQLFAAANTPPAR